MIRVPIASYQSLPSLNLVSWNVSLALPSHSSPDPSRRAREAPRLIREECLLRGGLAGGVGGGRVGDDDDVGDGACADRQLPDVIALQECPRPSFGIDLFGSDGYVSAGTQPSHCGYVDLLLRRELLTASHDDDVENDEPRFRPVSHPKYSLPAVSASFDLPCGTSVSVSSCHLAPSKGYGEVRMAQCHALMDLLADATDDCILLGDTNLREAEGDAVIRSRDDEWIDAWRACGSDKDSKFTWDSFSNRYHESGFKFRARYDRCYVRGKKVGANGFGLVGKGAVEGRGDHLSDHFGLAVGISTVSDDAVA